jgi:hypothetical protein
MLYSVAVAAVLVLGVMRLAPRFLGSAQAPTIEMTLSPSAMRGQDDIPTVHVPSRDARLQLRLNLSEPLPDKPGSFELLLQRDTDAPVVMPARRAADRRSVSVVLGEKGLAAGTYELTVRVRQGGSTSEDVDVYAFRVTIP